MNIRHKYTTASGLKMTLEERLKKIAKVENKDIMRLRKQVAFNRFLTRLFSPHNTHVLVLKGGYSLELRLNCARTTKDINLELNDKKAPFLFLAGTKSKFESLRSCRYAFIGRKNQNERQIIA